MTKITFENLNESTLNWLIRKNDINFPRQNWVLASDWKEHSFVCEKNLEKSVMLRISVENCLCEAYKTLTIFYPKKLLIK